MLLSTSACNITSKNEWECLCSCKTHRTSILLNCTSCVGGVEVPLTMCTNSYIEGIASSLTIDLKSMMASKLLMKRKLWSECNETLATIFLNTYQSMGILRICIGAEEKLAPSNMGPLVSTPDQPNIGIRSLFLYKQLLSDHKKYCAKIIITVSPLMEGCQISTKRTFQIDL